MIEIVLDFSSMPIVKRLRFMWAVLCGHALEVTGMSAEAMASKARSSIN